MKVLLLRHGETMGNQRRAYIGSTDEPLSPKGREQVQYVSLLVPLVERVYGSPMLRCCQTAEILFPGAEYHPVPDLRECDFGTFEGKTYEELKDDPAYRSWIDSGGEGEIPGGEPAPAFRRRCVKAFASLVEDAAGRGISSCAVVCHGGSIMAILAHYSGEGDFYRWQVQNAAGYFIQWEESAGREEKRVKVLGPFPPVQK